MWRFIGKLEKNAYLWRHKYNNTWAITLDRATAPLEEIGYYNLTMLLNNEGI